MVNILEAAIDLLINDEPVTSFVGNNIYPEMDDQASTFPNIVVFLIITNHENVMSRSSNFASSRIQFDCRAKDIKTASDVRKAVRQKLDNFRGVVRDLEIGSSIAINSVNDVIESPATEQKRTYIATIEVEMWHDE